MTPECELIDSDSDDYCAVAVNCDTESGKIVATITTIENDKYKCESKEVSERKYTFYILGVTNADSFIKSEKFDAYVLSEQYQYVVTLDPDMDPPVTVTNTIASDLKEEEFNVVQETKEFSAYTTYTLTIIPNNPIPRLGWVEIELPPGVGVADEETITSEYV
jgi:hypothetical protein